MHIKHANTFTHNAASRTNHNQDSDYFPESTSSETEPETELDPTTTDGDDPDDTKTASETSDSETEEGQAKKKSRAASGGIDKINLFDLSEDEFHELQETIYDLADEFLKTDGLTMAQPEFKDKMTKHIIDIIIDDLIESEIFTYDNYDDIKDICKEVIDVFFDSLQIPEYILTETETDTNTSKINLYDPANRKYKAILQSQIAYLRTQPQTAQKSEEWYRERHSLMTASNIWKPLGSIAQQNSFIAEKCTPFVLQAYQQTGAGGGGYCNTESPMHWGNKYEPLTKMVYEHKFTTVVEEFGCIKHATYSFIGASPDGINVDPESPRYGRMVEIKNIFNREITGIPSDKYWIQTQIQLETCGLDLCDFVETRFKEYDEPEFYQDTTREYRGVILYFLDTGNGSQMPIYEYMPLWVKLERATIEAWIQAQVQTHAFQKHTLYKTQYWYMDEFSCATIERNRKWFESAIPKLVEIKATIDRESISGFQHRISTRSTKLQKPIHPPICLVKLDENGNVNANTITRSQRK